MGTIDISRLENVRRTSRGITARCPACAEEGRDESGDHLHISEDGKFGCVLNPGPAGAEHRKRIFALVGVKDQRDERKPRIVKVYDYVDAAGRLKYQVLRYEPKAFRQRRPDGAEGFVWNLNGVERVLYRLPEVLKARNAGETIYVCEGEKDCDSLAALGLCSTCNAGGAGKWQSSYNETLTGAHVVILPDRDGPGREHAELVARELHGKAASVKVVELPDRAGRLVKDVHDWIEAGGTADELRELVSAALLYVPTRDEGAPRLSLITASELHDLELPAPVWVVPGLIPQGATLLCSKPKTGKSWLALQLAVAVASGGVFLAKYRCPKHGALYLGLEDTPRRLKDRLALMLHGERPPEGLRLVTDAPRMPHGLDMLARALDENDDVRLVLVDTLQRFRPPSAFRTGAYEGDYEALVPLKRLADERGKSMLLIHHVRKAGADDIFDTVNGTTGLTGAVDATLVIKRNRAEREGTLYGTGRDLEDVTLTLRFNPDGNWSAVEGASALPDAQAEVARALQEAGRPLSIKDVAERVNRTYDTAKKLLERMREAGRVAKERGGYIYTHSPMSLVPPVPHVPPIPRVPNVPAERGQRDIGDIGTYPPAIRGSGDIGDTSPRVRIEI